MPQGFFIEWCLLYAAVEREGYLNIENILI